jgi:hypothetical protein
MNNKLSHRRQKVQMYLFDLDCGPWHRLGCEPVMRDVCNRAGYKVMLPISHADLVMRDLEEKLSRM